MSAQRRPNVLMVLADQQNANWLGCAGHPQVQTPHFDRFAAGAMRFTRAYCQNPICTPSRTCILSGQYCHNHGYYGLSGPANFGLNNLFRHFRANGYRTGAWGKLHLPNSPRNWISDDVDILGDSYEATDGEFGRSEFLAMLEANGTRDLEDSWHNLSGTYGPQSIPHDAMVSKLPYEQTQEVWSAQQAMAFMAASGDQPFCVQVAFQKPHHPLLPQQRFWDLYPADLDLPPTWDLEPAGRAPHFRAVWQQLRNRRWEYAEPGEPVEAGPRREWRGTLACVSQIDDVFGQLLDFLDAQGLADDTIVVYGSDHGAYHGIHGIVEKAPGICSEEVCRVPLLWRAPGHTPAGGVCDALVENIDLTPTLASLCGLPEFSTSDGQDLSGLLAGGTAPVRVAAVTECPWSKSIRWGEWRLVRYASGTFDQPGDWDELYNLVDDPEETCNLAGDAACAAVRREGVELLLDWLVKTTRVTTAHPAVSDGEPGGRGEVGFRTYPLASDGRAPTAIQPGRHNYHRNYL